MEQIIGHLCGKTCHPPEMRCFITFLQMLIRKFPKNYTMLESGKTTYNLHQCTYQLRSLKRKVRSYLNSSIFPTKLTLCFGFSTPVEIGCVFVNKNFPPDIKIVTSETQRWFLKTGYNISDVMEGPRDPGKGT